jgi:hypothetical protein
MSVAGQALAIARLQIDGTTEEKAGVLAWERLSRMLGVLDSKTSVLLRFNAIVVAALAYLMVIRGIDPFVQSSAVVKAIGLFIGHASLVLSVASCGFCFPVINIEWESSGAPSAIDDGALQRLGALVAHRTRLYAWAWRLAVGAGAGFAILVALATIH